MNRRKNGFTIIELLAAIVIIGVLASVAVLVINRYIVQGHDSIDDQLSKQLLLSAKSYYSDNKTKFITKDDTGVVLWYTTLKANDYITNSLEDSNGNSCGKSYVVVKDNKYTSCIICDNDGYNNTKNDVCTESLSNNISCEWRDSNNNVLSNDSKIYLGVKSKNKTTLKLYCKGKGISFNDPTGQSTKLSNPVKGMFTYGNGDISVPSDSDNFTTNKNSKGEITSFVSNVIFTATNDGTGSVNFKLGSAYVNDNSGVPINNDDVSYSGIVIDGSGPSCKLSGAYKDSSLKTQVNSVKNGSVVYYGLSCSDDSGIVNVTSDAIKNGFESSSAISNLVVSNLVNSADKKNVNAVVAVTVSNPNINASKKVFNLSLVFKENIVKDSYDNGNLKASSMIDGKDSVLSIDDQGPTCAFNGPSDSALFNLKKSKLDVTNDDKNEYVFYELRCTDENGIDASTFRFSDIKSTEFGKIEQSGDRLAIKDNDGIVIGYRYLIKAYEKSVSSISKPIEAYLTYDSSNVKDSTSNSGSGNIKSLSVKMIDGKSVPTCSISVSYSNGYAILTGNMSSQSGLKGYAFSTDTGEVSKYNSVSGTSKSVTGNAYNNGVYYLHMIDENDLTGYCMTDSYIYIPTPDTPYITASDGKSSGDWHNSNYSLSASGSGSNVTYKYGTSESSMSTGSPTVSSETSGTTYYAKACWSTNTNICSSSAQYLAKLDKTPPTCEYSTRKLNPSESYTPGYWTQRNVEVAFTNRSDALSGINDDETYIQGYTQKWPNVYQTTVGNMSSRNHTAVVKCTDNAGNVTSKNVPIRIDTTPPRVTWSVSDGATVYVGDTVTARCVDGESSIEGIGGVFINGSDTAYGKTDLSSNIGTASVTFNSKGTKKLYITCSDKALNTTHDDYSYSNPQITVTVKEKVYFFSTQNSGSGTCYGNCCSSSPSTCNASTHGQIKYTGCSAETKTSYSYYWSQTRSGSSSSSYSGSSGTWCKNNGYSATYAGCASYDCDSSTYGKTCRSSSGGNGSKVYCTIKECKRSSSTSSTGYYKYTGSYKCLYKVE